MTSRGIVQVFEQYQKARLHFVQSVAEFALRPQNGELLEKGNVLDLLKPLIVDVCPQIRQCALIALGRLVHNDENLAEKMSKTGILDILMANLQTGTKYQKAAILFVLRAICKHSSKMAETVIKSGGLEALVYSLEDFEPSVKESAAWGIGYIARHSRALALSCVDTGALPLLMLCLQEPELSLKQIVTSAVTDIAKHSEDLAMAVVDAGVLPYLVKNLQNSDNKLKKQCLVALSSIARHSNELAETVVEAEIFPAVLQLLSHPSNAVRRAAAALVRDVTKHSLELVHLVVNIGGIGALLDVLYQAPGSPDKENDAQAPCISALGFIAGQSPQLAMAVLGCRTIQVFAVILKESNDDSLLAVTIWAVGQIGRHSPEHAQAVAAANIFPRLVELYGRPESSEDLKTKCRNALKLCLQNCILVTALEPLLWTAPPEILKYVLAQYSKVLPNDPKARRTFVTSGALKKVQEIEAEPGTLLMEYITVINTCFPEEIVRYYSPGYPETLLDKVEQYSPQMMTLLRERKISNEAMQTDNESDEEVNDNEPLTDADNPSNLAEQ